METSIYFHFKSGPLPFKSNCRKVLPNETLNCYGGTSEHNDFESY